MDERISGRRVLVTGATGFIGSHLVRRLDRLGAAVVAVSRERPAARVRRSVDAGISWRHADLAEESAVADLVRSVRPDVVFHLAGQVSGVRAPELVLPVLRNNLLSTVNLLVALDGQARVVLAGSEDTGDAAASHRTPSSPYAASKWASAGYARMFHALWDVPAVVLRVAMAYGPAQSDVTKLIPYVIRCLLAGRAPQLGSGVREIDWVYIDDVVDAFVAAACSDGVGGQTIDIGSGSSRSIREVVDMVSRRVGTGPEPEFGALRDRGHDGEWTADVGPAKALLDWKAATSLTSGLDETCGLVPTALRIPPRRTADVRRRPPALSPAARRCPPPAPRPRRPPRSGACRSAPRPAGRRRTGRPSPAAPRRARPG